MKKYICKHCGKEYQSGPKLGGHISRCKNNSKSKQYIKKVAMANTHIRKWYTFNCNKCKKQYNLYLSDNEYIKMKFTKFCSRRCANSRTWTQQDKLKKSIAAKNSEKLKYKAKINGIKQTKPLKIIICKYCSKQFLTKIKRKKFCSYECHNNFLKSDEYRIQKSNQTKLAYKNGKRVYGGITKWIQVQTSIGKFKVQGTYQVRMCKILDKMKQYSQIKEWQYTNDRIEYIAKDNEKHTYLLDFKVYHNDNSFRYIQTKGYEKQNDKYKWSAVRQKGYILQVCFEQNIKQYQQKYI